MYHYHNDHLGTPNELTNAGGEVIWLADYEAWGNTAKVVWREEKLESVQVTADELQPIRFQGQSFDEETGLHYNRFRYFDPDLGMFATRDPIGLMGGINTFQYAPNPTGWIDPFGLKTTAKLQGYIYSDVRIKGPHADIMVNGRKVTEAVLKSRPDGSLYWESFGNMKSASRSDLKSANKLIENLHSDDILMKKSKEQISQTIKDNKNLINNPSTTRREKELAERSLKRFEILQSCCN